MSERRGLEIDYCAQCRGVWLDRGELDKLIQLEGAQEPQPPVVTRTPIRGVERRDFDDSDYGKRHHGSGGYRRKSWLSDFFD